MPWGIYTLKVIILSLSSVLSILQHPSPSYLFLYQVNSLSVCLFLWHIEFSAAGAFKKTWRECRGVRQKTHRHTVNILRVLVNKTLACLLLMQCCSMHIVPGGAGHVWFIQCVPTQAEGFHTSYLYSWVKEFAESHLFIGWQRRWQTDPQVLECFLWWQMWRFDTVWTSHTCSLNESTFLPFTQM